VFKKKNKDWQNKKSYLVWQDSRSGQVWEREVTGLLDLEVRCSVCHARVGDWERNMDGLYRSVESGTQENGDEDWLFLIWFVRVERGGWTTGRVREYEIESLRLTKDLWIWDLWTESVNCEFVRVERGRLDVEDGCVLARVNNFCIYRTP
jgi:hypothetical protein